MNYTIINETNNILGQNVTSFKEICEINQYKILESVQRYPKIIFYLSLALFLFLMIDRIILPMIPKLYQYLGNETLIKVSSALSLANIYFITLFTFNITEINYKYISLALWIFSGILICATIYKNKEKIKELWKKREL